jgi:hypothetical protein
MENGINILSKENYDFVKAAVRLFGREMSAIAGAATKGLITGILLRESNSKKGHGICADALPGPLYSDEKFAEAISLFDALYRGLTD